MQELPSALAKLPALDGPAGVVSAPDGSLFYTVPLKNELWVKQACAQEFSLIPCINHDQGGRLSPLNMPRGTVVHPIRPALIVVDSGHDRLVLFDLQTFQLVG